MPELPEVETIRRQLASVLPASRVVAAAGHESPKFSDAAMVVGARLTAVLRRGKYLVIPTDDGRELVIHLGMTGHLTLSQTTPTNLDQDGTRPWRRAWWQFADGQLLDFTDQRRFGRIAVVTRGHYASLPTLAALGPEPLSPTFTPRGLHEALSAQHRHIKTALLSQRVVAGIGNIYADEALWRARINPTIRRLGVQRSEHLHAAIVAVLAEAVTHGGTRLRNYRTMSGDTGKHQRHLDCYGRTGEPCPRCGTTLARRMVDGRGTTWCPRCQAR